MKYIDVTRHSGLEVMQTVAKSAEAESSKVPVSETAVTAAVGWTSSAPKAVRLSLPIRSGKPGRVRDPPAARVELQGGLRA